MATIKLEVITAERTVYRQDVDMIVAPGVDGELGILPHHTLLMTMLKPGELRIKIGGEEQVLAVSGGFLQVLPDRVTILADTAERVEEIDLARAEAAKQRAQEKLKAGLTGTELSQEDAALRRALARIMVAEKYKKRGGSGRSAPKT
jgi:F-type H+-transporting ATPase subunit epsilon